MSNFNPQQLATLAKQFIIEGDVLNVLPFGSGHINDTYRVHVRGTGSDYLLQRINHHVFGDVPALMQNIMRVTQHLKRKYDSFGGDNLPVADRVLTLIPTEAGLTYHRDEAGNFWRMFILLANTRSYDIVETPLQAKEGGRAFGQFQRLLSDLDAHLIHEVLPDFHHIGKRLAKLDSAIAADRVNRVCRVADEITFIKRRENRMHTLLNLAAAGKLPLRITHNDTKFNNVLLDVHDRAQCVIDLDTVMPGYVAYDFGDAIRTIINSAAEDEADLRKITLNIPLFEAYTAGYFEEADSFLTASEVNSLIEGILLLPYMQAVRFLTDFLEGDHYYKTHHADHNLQRARAQLKLVELVEAHEHVLQDCIHRTAGRYT
ncbi:aminoglycoside phosphotransferase family protein [Parapedobacter sp. ISTM3]|uniref:Phosphotransferase enzyme family protein n=1 Tax=Parapedobacter luteus TaxID=623280 RepID=A0A1T5AP73_9SPHI|nr:MULTISPECIES: aminoglycoside phosphotransferase family protein [Parapedobacter]MBK1441932.1 aminoglycoside phosphotransferase family protein [Parapedobacter sp. ISTM3]SKB36768.1 Phosphotransferase enzyme family protein [Parapedobacter luteus]